MLDSYADFGEDFEDDEFFEDDDFYEEDEDLFSPEDIETMESLAAEFAEGYEDDPDEEDAFLGALAGLAAKALPMAMKAAPMLLNAGRSILGGLSRSRTVRSAARAVPHIMRRTAADQLRRYSRGRPVTRQSTMRSAARHTANALHPRNRRRIVQRHRKYVRRSPTRVTRRYPNRRPSRYTPRVRRVCRCRMVRY